MPLTSGTKLGPYEIHSPLGAGGMGEVYRARDTRLERTVAIKVLPQLSDNRDLQQRFEREARTISSLQHPHICVLHDIGRDPATGADFLVMEYLEGETLAERLRKGALPLAQQLIIAMEIADALAAAHAAGIVHRDLKPGNVMLTASGAKLLDFGLAKPLAAMATSSAATSAPSFTAAATLSGPSPMISPLTTHGSIVGTIQYMSPEQIEGKEADARSDIFAFGSMLYEMASGKRPFEGKSQIKIASAILEDQPPALGMVQPGLPAALERVVTTCLSKDPRDRFQCAHDLKLELGWIRSAVTAAKPNRAEAPPMVTERIWWAGVLVALLLAAMGATLLWRRPSEPMSIQAYLLPPENSKFTLASDDAAGPIVLSPDGKQVAFVAQDAHGQDRIYVQGLEDNQAMPVPGTEYATYPFWSADGKSLGFQSGGKLRRVEVGGGPVLDICNVARFRGGSWGAQGILFAPDVTSGIFRVAPNADSTPVQLTTIAADQTTNRWPLFLPDGKHFLYLASNHSDPGANGRNGIYFASLDGTEHHFVVAAESNAVYADGRLFWQQGGSLLTQAFNPAKGTLRGETVALAGGVAYNGSTWRAAFDVNPNGVLVYQPGLGASKSQVLLYTADGKSAALPDSSAMMDIRISPDGRKLAVLARSNHEVWLIDTAAGMRVRFTFAATADGLAWSGDSTYLYYASLGKNSRIIRKAVDGSGQETTVLESPEPLHVSDVSRDGKLLLFEQRSNRIPTTTWVLPLTAGGKPRLLTEDPVGTHFARFSPDAKWVTYVTTETGRNELYLKAVYGGGKQQLTSAGGWQSRWAADGKTIYYVNDEGLVSALPVTVHGEAVEPGKARGLFKAPSLMPASFYSASWDVTADGHRFVLNVSGDEEDQSRATLISNWRSRLKK